MEPATDSEDRADMESLAAGNDEALNRLMDRHAKPIFHYLIRLFQNEADAEEAAQETFVRLYQHRTRFNSKKKLVPWLYAIATNLARDRMRWQKRHPELSLETPINSAGQTLSETLIEERMVPGQALLAEEEAQAVRCAVGKLPEELRIPLILFECEDQSHAEIAEALACSVKAVETRIYRGRNQLRKSLEKWFQKS